MPRHSPAFPAPGVVGHDDLPVVLRGVLCAEPVWSTVVLRGTWPGSGVPLEQLWRADAVHAEGDGVVLVLDGGRTVLTVTSPGGASVVHRRGTVSVVIATAASAVLERDGEIVAPSFGVASTAAPPATGLLTGGRSAPRVPGVRRLGGSARRTPSVPARVGRLLTGAVPAVEVVAVV